MENKKNTDATSISHQIRDIIKNNDPFWENIDIERDIAIHLCHGKDNIWIENKKTHKRLEVILEPMVIKYPRLYPHGNYYFNNENNEENGDHKEFKENENKKRKKIYHQYYTTELQKARYQLRLEAEDYEYHTNSIHEKGQECLNWLKKLEKHIIHQSIKLGLWEEEFKNVKEEILEQMEMENEEIYDDKLANANSSEIINKRAMQVMCRKVLDNNNGHIKHYLDSNGRPIQEKSKYLTISECVYVTYKNDNYVNLIKQNGIQFTEEEKKNLQLHKTMKIKNDDKFNHFSKKEIKTNGNIHCYFKNIIPFYNHNGQIILQENDQCAIQHGDVVCICLSFQKRKYPIFGIKYKINWIQLFQKKKRLKGIKNK